MRLSDLKPGQSAVILKVTGHGAFRKRIMEMGFVRGKRVTVVLDAPLRDPVKYKIMDYEVSLRRSEAQMIVVITDEQAASMTKADSPGGEARYHTADNVIDRSKKTINIALVGNPNSGKTSLFNAASGSHQHVGNYGGVTVDAKRGGFNYGGYRFIIFDLPGTYALSAYSPEEMYVRSHIEKHTPDVIVNVVAASNLERNLFLSTELIDMDCPMVMALNMYDELEAKGAKLDYQTLGEMLGVPIVPTVSRSGRGLGKLFDKVIEIYENNEPTIRHIHIPHSTDLERVIDQLESEIEKGHTVHQCFSARYFAAKILEHDTEIEKLLSRDPEYPAWIQLRDELVADYEKKNGEDIETTLTNDKYGFISGAMKETYTPGQEEEIQTTRVLDSFVTHKLFGFPIFFLIMWVMFEATFRIGAYPMEWIEGGVEWLKSFLGSAMPQGMLKDLLIDGVLGGVGGVIVFLPNILILYLFISFMEDSGYMARAAFIMDRVMHRIGLHGKSFIPLVMGFGCNVPAIMASRTIESRSSRIITILINPFMSCSARLPVYILLIGTFFPRHGSLLLFSLYIFGIVIAVLTSLALRKFRFKKDETPFVMELPPYRMPTARSTVRHMWDKAVQYLRKMGGIILIASIIIWFLSYFPRTSETTPEYGFVSSLTEITSDPDRIEEIAGAIEVDETEAYIESRLTAIERGYPDSMGLAEGTPESNFSNVPEKSPSAFPEDGDMVGFFSDEEAFGRYNQQANSYLGRFGRTIAPVMEPLGFDWKTTVALITGAAAKELIVSTLGVLYSESADPDAGNLSERLMSPDPFTGKPALNTVSALALLVFVLLYFPCIAAMVAIVRETASWRWALFSFVYNTLIAWVCGFIVYNIGSLFIN